jgi:hypothetical protein
MNGTSASAVGILAIASTAFAVDKWDKWVVVTLFEVRQCRVAVAKPE